MIGKKAFFLVLMVFLYSCGENGSVPKPYAFSRVDRVNSGMGLYEGDKFTFSYSNEAKIEPLASKDNSEIWLNIAYPRYNAIVHCTYIPIRKNIRELLEDSYQLAFSHAVKANGIEQTTINNLHTNSSGILYDIKGRVAVPVQFFVTDSINNFFRGSLYYNQIVNPDSVAPTTDFLRADIIQLMESMKWTNSVE